MHIFFTVLAVIAIGLQGLALYHALFGPDLAYSIKDPPEGPLNSPFFCSLLSSLTQAEFQAGNAVEVLTDGPSFYRAQLEAIQAATTTVNLEAYIFHKGEISRQYVQTLAERARAGVQVKLTLDYIGSFTTPRSYFKELSDAGGQMKWYHSFRPSTLLSVNNRTHRELMVVDGRIGFVGGAGIADWWYKDGVKGKRWRDTVLRVEGPAVAALQSVFAQNWLRVAGEILTGKGYFHFPDHPAGPPALVVGSTPAAGSTQARILFQTLITSAQKCIYVTTPYFLPDRGARTALIRAVRERGVQVKILTPGDNNDERLTRASSRELYGSLLKHGIQIFEYRPSMIHVKALMIDNCWTVVGSTNFDYRSFDLNDEVNLAILDSSVNAKLSSDFEKDLSEANEITYEGWRQKVRFRIADRIVSVLERQE